ncbi:MAG: hypothetical protein ACOVOV_18780 [Dolichospermum sp.]
MKSKSQILQEIERLRRDQQKTKDPFRLAFLQGKINALLDIIEKINEKEKNQ